MTVRDIIFEARGLWPDERLGEPEAAEAFVAHVFDRAGPARKLAAARRMAALARGLGISLPLPKLTAPRKLPEPARPANWPQMAERVLQAAARCDLALTRRAKTPEACAAMALASGVLRAGLTRPEAWGPFVKALVNGQAFGRAQALGDLVWLTLELPREMGRLAQEEHVETLRVFLDPITLSLAARAKGAKITAQSPKELLALAMAAIDAQLTVAEAQAAGFAAVEDRAPQRIPAVIFEVARGAVAAFSASESAWCAMLSGRPCARAIKAAGAQAPKAPPKVALNVELSILRLRGALLASSGPKPSRQRSRAALLAALRAAPVPVIRGLALWLLALESERYAVSTLSRYGLPLASMLGLIFKDRDPAQMAAGEIEYLIEEALEAVPRGERAYRAARIAQFLQFASEDVRLGWPDVVLSVEAGAQRPRVRTALVGPALLTRALAGFGDDLMGQAAVLLGARGGLRLSDMEALRVGDVEIGDTGMVMIHQTKWGNLKSAAGRRVVPLARLLTGEEIVIWRRFCARRRAEATTPDAPFLATGGGILPEIRFERADFARGLMESAGLRPHDLRHGALSNLSLLVLAPEGAGAVEALTGWGKAQQRVLRALFCGADPWGGMRQIARLAGHRDPATTLESYIHLCDLALGLHLVAGAAPMPCADLARALGRNRRSLPKAPFLSAEALRPQIVAKLPRRQMQRAKPVTLPAPVAPQLSVELILKIEAMIVQDRPAPEIATQFALPLRQINAQINAPRIGRLRAAKDQAAAVALAKRVLATREPQAWAAQTLKAGERRIVLSATAAQDWRAPLGLLVKAEEVSLATAKGAVLRHALTPIAPSGANGMGLFKMAARIVGVMIGS